MISLESLSHNYLPNLYVKNVTLDSTYKSEVLKKNNNFGYFDPNADDVNVLVPDGTGNSRVVLSAKFAKNDSLMSDIALLLDSELNQYFKIYVHQFTDKAIYDAFFTIGGALSLLDSNGNITEEGKKVLISNNSSLGTITTKTIPFSEAILNNNAALGGTGGAAAFDAGVKLPKQILEDGTVLNEIVFEMNFDLPKNPDFLAYVMVAGVSHTGNADVSNDVYISNPKKEIVILDSVVQDRGLMFTIANPTPGQGNLQELSKYGKPGDTWVGPVHEHQGVFMAGASHTNKPHPRLTYSVVPLTKFIDNRVKEKIEKTIFNKTQALSSLSPLETKFQDKPSFLSFKDYMSQAYISDIYLTQDQESNVSGIFFVDKLKILKYNSTFSAMFDAAATVFGIGSQQYKNFIQNVLSEAELFGLYVYEGNKLLGQISNGEATSIEPEDENGNIFTITNQTQAFLSFNNSNAQTFSYGEIETFSFKHIIASSTTSHYDYYVKVEYKDPTTEIVKNFYNAFNQRTEVLATLINFITSQNGFEPVTQTIKKSVLDQIVATYPESISQNIQAEPVFVYIAGEEISLFKILFSIQGLTNIQFSQYLYKLSNLSSVTQEGLLTLQSFMINIANKIENSLSAVGSKPTKNDDGVYGSYVKETGTGVGTSETDRKRVSILSKRNRVMTHDYGYDFTAAIDSNVLGNPPGTELNSRNNAGFMIIRRPEFKMLCKYLFNSFLSYIGKQNPGTTIFIPGGAQQAANETIYSYINIPVNVKALKDSVMLPPTVMSLQQGIGNFNLSDLFNSKNILTGIIKLKNYIIENNSFAIFGIQPSDKSLKEDLISILAQGGTSLPSVGQTQLERVVSAEMTQLEANLVQKDQTISKPTKAGTSFQLDPGFSTANVDFKIDPALGVQANKFKLNPPYKQTVVKGNLDTTKNNLMNSLLIRQLTTNAGKEYSFDLRKQFSGLSIASQDEIPFPHQLASLTFDLALGGEAPVETVILFPDGGADASLPPGTPFVAANPFVNFKIDQGYIKNLVINPNRLADFWFKHQNIVRIEYLSGFGQYNETKYLENQNNPYESGEGVIITEKNVKKPTWERLTAAAVNTNSKLICRIVKYKQTAFINSHLVKELDMPLINSYFILD